MAPGKSTNAKSTRPVALTVGNFFDRHHDELQLKLIGNQVGFERKIIEPTINRPGLALCDFYEYFAFKRIQVLGHSELSYLKSLPSEVRRERLESLCSRGIPCIVIARGMDPPEFLVEIANREEIALFSTNMVSMKFINAATMKLEREFSLSATMHGCMLDVRGMGVFIIGKSGSGKSECALALLDRGASLVADDVVHFRLDGNNNRIYGTAPEMTRFHLEVRGLGIIHAAALFGIGAVRHEKRLDMVVELAPAANLNDLERFGAEPEEYEVLGMSIPKVQIAVTPGQNVGKLVEVAALHLKLRTLGYDTAVEFNKNLLKKMGVEPF